MIFSIPNGMGGRDEHVVAENTAIVVSAFFVTLGQTVVVLVNFSDGEAIEISNNPMRNYVGSRITCMGAVNIPPVHTATTVVEVPDRTVPETARVTINRPTRGVETTPAGTISVDPREFGWFCNGTSPVYERPQEENNSESPYIIRFEQE